MIQLQPDLCTGDCSRARDFSKLFCFLHRSSATVALSSLPALTSWICSRPPLTSCDISALSFGFSVGIGSLSSTFRRIGFRSDFRRSSTGLAEGDGVDLVRSGRPCRSIGIGGICASSSEKGLNAMVFIRRLPSFCVSSNLELPLTTTASKDSKIEEIEPTITAS